MFPSSHLSPPGGVSQTSRRFGAGHERAHFDILEAQAEAGYCQVKDATVGFGQAAALSTCSASALYSFSELHPKTRVLVGEIASPELIVDIRQ